MTTMSEHQPSPPEGADPPEEPDSRRLLVALDTESNDPPDPAWLEQMLRRVCGLLELRIAALNVIVIDDDRMADLHRQYRGVEGTTDVLTFDLADPPPANSKTSPDPEAIEGEVYICLDEARRRADQLAHPVRHELLLYAVHGLLHLVGYDDHDPDRRRLMHEKEDELLSALGIGPVFHHDGENIP